MRYKGKKNKTKQYTTAVFLVLELCESSLYEAGRSKTSEMV